MVELGKLDHVAVVVESAKKSLDFYQGVLGMKLTGKAKSKVTGDTYTHLIHQKEGVYDSHVELVEVSKKSPLAKAKMANPGINHMAYRVKDIKSTIEDFRRDGYKILLKPTVIGDITFAYVRTKDNYVFEVMEMPSKYKNSYEV